MSAAQARPRRRGPREYRGPARSCEHCFGWGVLRQRLCRGCENFAAKYPAGQCRTCRRSVPVDAGVCRLCRRQASRIAGPDNKTALDLTVAAVTGHQLFFADTMRRSRRRTRPPVPADHAELAVIRDQPGSIRAQLLLVDPPRDCRGASSLDPPRDPLFLDLVMRQADSVAELNGWPPRTLQQVRRGLGMLASSHDPGEPIRASTVTALSPHGIPGLRVLEVLTAADEGLLIDDRPDSLTVWIDDQFRDLPPRIREELQVWIDVLRRGTPRRKSRHRSTVFSRLAGTKPFLVEVAARYDTLRQVTRADVVAWLDGRKHGANDASALRDLFRVLKAERMVFTNPTHRIKVAESSETTPTSLSPDSLRQLGAAAERDPALRVVLGFVGVQALSPNQLRRLRLDQLDRANGRFHLDGSDRTLDTYTTAAVVAYLVYRHDRWPGTSNPHLLVTRRTAHERNAVSEYWLSSRLRDLPVTLRELREDRILDEAHASGGDPLHLAAMFGLTAQPALRYAKTVLPGLAATYDDHEPKGR